MTGTGPVDATLPDPWEEQGRRAAPAIASVSSVVVLGSDPQCAARVALGIARAESARRRVALGDLVGDLAPLYAAAGGEDAFGLSDCLRGGLSLNEVARPSPECEALFILPAGTPPVATSDVLAHARWPRLVNGFTQAGALLVLVAPLDAPGLETLVAAMGGVVAVGVPARRVRQFNVLATVEAPEPLHPTRPALVAPPRNARKRLGAISLVAVVVVLMAAAWFARSRRSPRAPIAGTSPVATGVAAPGAPGASSTAVPALPDTVDVRERVNPGDSARALLFAVEVVAANTSAGANSFLRDSELPAVTVVPVQSGSGTLWYKLIVGAWRSRNAADSLLDALRERRVVERGAGRVVRVPYALLLAGGLAPDGAREVVSSWRRRDVFAYALLQDDGSVRVFAGAFETAAQAAPLAASLRDAGAAPLVAFRTGRPF